MFHKRIKLYRKKLGWSQQKLAEKTGLSYPTITKIEQNHSKDPSIRTVIKIADALNVSLDELVGRKVKKK